MAEFIFYSSIILISYTYLGYPILLILISLFVHKPVDRGDIFPHVALIIPVFNAEQLIGEKLENCLAFDYPKEKLRIIVVSDGSQDGTEGVVRTFESKGVEFLALPFRGGKVAAQNYALQFVDSEVVIFSDAAISNDPNCIKLIVENFYDKNIGAVSCRDVVIGVGSEKAGESSYISYDMFVRRYTSRIGTIIGLTGGFYAVRSEIAKGGWNPAFPPDFYVALRTLKRGLRVIEDERVKAYYKTASKEWDELSRKVRTLNRGMRALFSVSNWTLLNPFRYKLISLELISHKVFRWMTPLFLFSLFVSNILILDENEWSFLPFIIQVGFYLVGILAFILVKNNIGEKTFKIIFFFIMANMAILKAWYEFFIGKKYEVWEPTKR